MASNSDFVQYIVDQCSGAGEIAVRKMMGDYCIYCDGIIFGLICDNNLYIKETDAGRAVLKEEVLRSRTRAQSTISTLKMWMIGTIWKPLYGLLCPSF